MITLQSHEKTFMRDDVVVKHHRSGKSCVSVTCSDVIARDCEYALYRISAFYIARALLGR